MNAMLLLNAVAVIGGLTLVLATLLVFANRWLHVVDDPRIGRVLQMLPHTNCGSCGYPGCRAFAEALVAGEVLPGKCSVGTPQDRLRIASYLGVDVGETDKRVARLACAGGTNVARARANYQGLESCAAAALVAGGGKGCFWGCLGLGDCQRACDFAAIEMNQHQLPVVAEDRCTGCGDCVESCPKDLFSLRSVNDRLWVACSSLAEGDAILGDCEVACTGCARCAMDAPDQIEMKNGLPVIDYHTVPLTAAPTERCPTGAIVWLDRNAGPVKGHAANKVIRTGKIHDAPS